MAKSATKLKNFRLTLQAVQMLEMLAHELGISQTSVIETLIRDRAKKEKIVIRPDGAALHNG